MTVDDKPLRPSIRGAHVDPPPILTVKDLEVAYGPTQVIFGVSLEVPDGGLCCLMGRNGVGKTHAAADDRRAAAGARRHDLARRRGHHEGRRRTTARRRGIAYVPQGREAFPYLTVFENLRVVAEASAKSGPDASTRRSSASRGCARSSTARRASSAAARRSSSRSPARW